MNLAKVLLLLCVVAIGFTACDKDDVSSSIDSGLVGTWEGMWGYNSEAPKYSETWVIQSNGKVEAYNDSGDLYARGTCKVDGVNFAMEYTSVGGTYTYKFFGLYHDQLNEILGTWGKTPSATNGGSFEMYKEN